MIDEDIDTAQHLPRRMVFITPERADKGDIRVEYDDNGNIRFAQSQVKNILNYLWEKEIITDQQHHDGQTFEIWRDMHRVQLESKKAVSSGGEEAIGVRLRAYGFVLLLKRLSIPDQNTIESSIERPASNHYCFIADNNTNAYKRTFERLSDVLLPIKEQIQYLEQLSEDERGAIAEDNLKKLIAELVKCR